MGKSRKVDYLKRATRDKNTNMRKGKAHKTKKGDSKTMRKSKKKDILSMMDEASMTTSITGYLSNVKQGCALDGSKKPYYLDDKAKIKHSLKENFAPLLKMLLEIEDPEDDFDSSEYGADEFLDPDEARSRTSKDFDEEESEVLSDDDDLPEIEKLEMSKFGSSGPTFRRKLIGEIGEEEYQRLMNQAHRDRLQTNRELYGKRKDDLDPSWAVEPLGEKDPFSGKDIPKDLQGMQPKHASEKIVRDEQRERESRSSAPVRVKGSKKGKGGLEKQNQLSQKGLAHFMKPENQSEEALQVLKSYLKLRGDRMFMNSHFASFPQKLVDELESALEGSGLRGLKLTSSPEGNDKLFRIFADAQVLDPSLILKFVKYYQANRKEVYEGNKRAEAEDAEFQPGSFRGYKGAGGSSVETEMGFDPREEQDEVIDTKRSLDVEPDSDFESKLGAMTDKYFGYSPRSETNEDVKGILQKVESQWGSDQTLDRDFLSKIGVGDKELLKVLYQTVTSKSFLSKAFVKIASLARGRGLDISPGEVKDLYGRNFKKSISGASGYKTLVPPQYADLKSDAEAGVYNLISKTLAPEKLMKRTSGSRKTAMKELSRMSDEERDLVSSLPVDHIREMILAKVDSQARREKGKEDFQKQKDEKLSAQDEKLRNIRKAAEADPEKIRGRAQARRDKAATQSPRLSMRSSPGIRGHASSGIEHLPGGVEELEGRLKDAQRRVAAIQKQFQDPQVTPITKSRLEKALASSQEMASRIQNQIQRQKKFEDEYYTQTAPEDRGIYQKGRPFISPPEGTERPSLATTKAEERERSKEERRAEKARKAKSKEDATANRGKMAAEIQAKEDKTTVDSDFMKKIQDILKNKLGDKKPEKKKIAESLKAYRKRIKESGLSNSIHSLKQLVLEDIETESLKFDLTEMLLSAESGDKEVEAGEKKKAWHKAKPAKQKNFYPKLSEAIDRIRGKK